MKISNLEIEKYRHLENLSFDFTYQSGPKKGQPLDKICFIGQSASGKTSLLELVYEQILNSLKAEVIEGNSISIESKVHELVGQVEIRFENKVFKNKNGIVFYDNKKYDNDNFGGQVTPLVAFKEKKNLLYYNSNLISEKNIDVFTKNPFDLFEKYSDVSKLAIDLNGDEILNDYQPELLNFNDDVNPVLWIRFLEQILMYRKKFNQKMSDLIHKGLLANPQKLSSEFQKWEKENPNSLNKFAEKFNPILEKLNLEVDVIDTEYSIPIKNKTTDEIIPIQNTSTGTKGLLLSFLPMYSLNTDDSIIIIDEPERSLFPDIQMELIPFYQSLAPKAQFIVATHSPFIAAAFEPEERFILYFDDKGKVQYRTGVSPIGDDPNDILKNDFDINLMNDFGINAYKKYLDLKTQMASEIDEIKKKALLKEVILLGDKYKF